MARWHTTAPSPVGDLVLVRTDKGLSGLYMEVTRRPLTEQITGALEDRGFERVKAQLAEYFAGQRQDFDVELDLHGTPFQLQVWQQLLQIPYGQTRSYQAIADALGNPQAVRAVGAANGRNPVSIIVPCHRVIGSDGSLTGYGGGIERKKHLLAMEQATLF